MPRSSSKPFFIFILCILGAMCLMILPLPKWANWFRPQWVFLILIYWIAFVPSSIGLGTVWILGLLIDLLTGTVLGQHAFTFVVTLYILMRVHPQFHVFPIWQQTLIVALLSLLNLALQYWIISLIGLHPGTWAYWYPAISNTIIWPWLAQFLQSSRSRLRFSAD